MKHILFFLVIMTLTTFSTQAQTLKQTPVGEPDMPKPLAAAVEGGAQVMYLGAFEGLYGWSLIRQGRPEFYYSNADGTALVMGLLFDGEGEMITSGQLAQLKANKGDEMFAMTGGIDEENTAPISTAPSQAAPRPQQPVTGLATSIVDTPLTPAQEMFVDVQSANWVTIGNNGEYEIFAFLDPDCPHCQRFAKEAKPFIEKGILKIRALPIGIDPVSERKAALMLAGTNPLDRFIRYADGDETALNAPNNISVAGVQKNKSVLQKWGFDVTPVIVYRTGKGEIRIVRGRPKDFVSVIEDIIRN